MSKIFSFLKFGSGGFFSSIWLGLKTLIQYIWKYKDIMLTVIIALIILYGTIRIGSLEKERIELKNQVQEVVNVNEQLQTNYNELNQRFNTFTVTVKDNLMQQSVITSKLSGVQNNSNKRITNLYNTFNTSANGKDRNLYEIIDRKPGLFERRINNGTQSIGEEFEKLTR